MEQAREWPIELLVGLREEAAETRTTIRHVESDLGELRQDIRRVDGRLFQLLLTQVATLATALGALVATLAS